MLVGGAVPAAQRLTLNKAGHNGTYFEVTTSGAATSSLTGRFNAFRTNQTDSKSINVGLSTTTATAGLRSGTVTIDNLDITTGGMRWRRVRRERRQRHVQRQPHGARPCDAVVRIAVAEHVADDRLWQYGVWRAAAAPQNFDVYDLNALRRVRRPAWISTA